MVNIVISQNKTVSGDCGKIIAYEGQEYSEVINIVHPIIAATESYIEYKYNNTIFRNKLDANNLVSIKVENAGYVQCQYIAVNVLTGNVEFKSNYWYFMINRQIQIEPSHYPCNAVGHIYSHRPPINMMPMHCYNCDLEDTVKKLQNDIINECGIRFNELQNIQSEIEKLKIHTNYSNPVYQTLNANEITIPDTYYANEYSSGFPENNKEYILKVSKYNINSILQEAQEKNSNNMYYRSASSIDVDGSPNWNDWTQLILQ